MLKAPTPFPEVGSYALLVDPNLPESQRRAELVRIQRRGPITAAVSFPLRQGASGNRVVPLPDLIDGTPLTKEEERQLADLQREMRGVAKPARRKIAEAETLRQRLVMSTVLKREIDKLGYVEEQTNRLGMLRVGAAA